MKVSENGIKLIEKFEGCKLTSYKDSVGVLTIGYGHTGKDVKENMKISKAEAIELLKKDIEKFEKHVNIYNEIYMFNQNQFDALVSFAFNVGNIKQLTKDGSRTLNEISKSILLYNKANGKVLKGLTKRREAEYKLFNTYVPEVTNNDIYYPKYVGSSNSISEGLKAVGETDTSFIHRKEIAKRNDIISYKGTYSQNILLVRLLKAGKLKR